MWNLVIWRKSFSASLHVRPSNTRPLPFFWAHGQTQRSCIRLPSILTHGVTPHILEKMPRVRYFTMGLNKWQTSDTWPLQGAQPMTWYLSSGGKANSPNGTARWRAHRRARTRRMGLATIP